WRSAKPASAGVACITGSRPCRSSRSCSARNECRSTHDINRSYTVGLTDPVRFVLEKRDSLWNLLNRIHRNVHRYQAGRDRNIVLSTHDCPPLRLLYLLLPGTSAG